MSDMNIVIVQGRIVKDATIRLLQSSGKKVADFSIAVNRVRKNSQGEYEGVAEFFQISTFLNSEKIAKYLVKGQTVCIEGFLKQDSWVQADGKKRVQNNIGVKKLHLLFGKRQESEPPKDNESEIEVIDSENYSEDIFIGENEEIY